MKRHAIRFFSGKTRMILTFFTGLLLSFLGSMIPTGPIAVIVLQYGMRRQKLSAIFVASGAALAESGYALLAYLGINFVLSRYPLQNFLLRLICGFLLIAFAAVWMIGSRTRRKISGDREYVGASFLLGLSIAGLNPTFLATWAGAVAFARGTGLISEIGAAPAFAIGVAAGPILWFWILLGLLARHAETLRPENLQKIEKALPIILFIMAGIILIQAFLSL
jgi:threonine/homoserine/homoserine lactone efflux protein